jgi:hypothetical protein
MSLPEARVRREAAEGLPLLPMMTLDGCRNCDPTRFVPFVVAQMVSVSRNAEPYTPSKRTGSRWSSMRSIFLVSVWTVAASRKGGDEDE